mgnify:CR=1 FL=1
MYWKDIKLRKKFFISFGILILVLSGLALWAINGLGNILGNAEEVIEGNKLRTEVTKKHVDHLVWSEDVSRFLIDDNVNTLNVQTDFHKCALGKWYYGDERKHAEELVPEIKPVMKAIEQPHIELHQSAIKIDKQYHGDDLEGAFETYKTVTLKNLEMIGGLLHQAEDLYKENIMTDEQMLAEADKTRAGVIIFSIIAVLFSILIAYVITNGILTPIKKGVVFANQISAGDLTATINVDQKDEIGQFTEALKKMADKLRIIVSDIIHGADNINAASLQLSDASQQMSQGSSEQASSAEEVSSSMEQMAANIQQNTENAQLTETIALKAAKDIEQGNQAVNETVLSMKDIAEKIKIIGEIARQTNILALNAAVEAARAGEYGKGFAVVAAEVRKLAERSQEAAKEIDEKSHSSVLTAEKSGKILKDIVPDIEKTSKLIQEIAAASIEQNSGADQINSALQQLNEITQRNAASSEELATSSEELSGQSESLKEVISFFKIDQRSYANKNVKTTHNYNKSSSTQKKTNTNFELILDN